MWPGCCYFPSCFVLSLPHFCLISPYPQRSGNTKKSRPGSGTHRTQVHSSGPRSTVWGGGFDRRRNLQTCWSSVVLIRRSEQDVGLLLSTWLPPNGKSQLLDSRKSRVWRQCMECKRWGAVNDMMMCAGIWGVLNRKRSWHFSSEDCWRAVHVKQYSFVYWRKVGMLQTHSQWRRNWTNAKYSQIYSDTFNISIFIHHNLENGNKIWQNSE